MKCFHYPKKNQKNRAPLRPSKCLQFFLPTLEIYHLFVLSVYLLLLLLLLFFFHSKNQKSAVRFQARLNRIEVQSERFFKLV